MNKNFVTAVNIWCRPDIAVGGLVGGFSMGKGSDHLQMHLSEEGTVWLKSKKWKGETKTEFADGYCLPFMVTVCWY